MQANRIQWQSCLKNVAPHPQQLFSNVVILPLLPSAIIVDYFFLFHIRKMWASSVA